MRTTTEPKLLLKVDKEISDKIERKAKIEALKMLFERQYNCKYNRKRMEEIVESEEYDYGIQLRDLILELERK